jgi:predicted site-specific integrase-resolvase
VPININGVTYYRTTEVCKIVGIGRSTLLRWFSSGIINDTSHRDWRGWRLFTKTDIHSIQRKADYMS